MPSFGKSSTRQLVTLEQDIQTILNEAIKWYDFSIIEGQRTAERQNEHWAKGRELKPGGDPRRRADWVVVDDRKIVTTKDGYEKLSNHQSQPKGKAVDIWPYPFKPEYWNDENKHVWYELAGVIKSTQERLLHEGKIKNTLDWGRDLWDWDNPHWQLKP